MGTEKYGIFYFGYTAIGFCIMSFICANILVNLLKVRHKTKPTLYLSSFFIIWFITAISYSICLSVLSHYAVYANYGVNLFFFSTPLILQFIYLFPSNIHEKESKIIFWTSALLSFASYFYYIGQTYNSPIIFNFRANSFFFSNESEAIFPGSVVFFLQYIWIVTLIFRKAYSYKKKFEREFTSLIIAVIVPIIVSILILLASKELIPWDIYHFALSGLSTLAFFVYTVIYINNSSIPTSFKDKLINIFLITGMIFSSLLAFLIYTIQMNREFVRDKDIVKIISNSTQNKFSELPSSIGFIIAKPKDKPISVLYTSQYFSKKSFYSLNYMEEKYSFYSFTFSFFDYKDPYTFSVVYRFLKDNLEYNVGFNYMESRKLMHEYVMFFLMLIFFCYFFIIIALPYFYKISIIDRLDKLMMGVKEANKGNFSVKIPVVIEDEIGFLSKSLNNLLHAFRKYTQDHENLVSLKQELNLAKKIQMASLPTKIPEIEGLHISANYIPMNEVGGDFYDFCKLNEYRIGIFIADVSGHGIPAAMGASMVKIAFSQSSFYYKDPARILSNINESLFSRLNHAFVTAAYIYIDSRKGTIKYSNAGHPGFIHYNKKENKVKEVFVKGSCIGIISKSPKYQNVEIHLNKGDRVVLFTDGITECIDPNKELFGEDRLKEFILENASLNAEDLIQQLNLKLKEWSGNKDKFEDDITILVIDKV